MAAREPQYRVQDNKVYETVIPFRTVIYDDVYGDRDRAGAVREEVNAWRRTDAGRWCEERCICLQTLDQVDYATLSCHIVVKGLMTPQDATYYRIKWGHLAS